MYSNKTRNKSRKPILRYDQLKLVRVTDNSSINFEMFLISSSCNLQLIFKHFPTKTFAFSTAGHIQNYLKLNLKASQMGHFMMVSLWCASLSTNTRFCLLYFRMLCTYDVTSRASEWPREAIKGIFTDSSNIISMAWIRRFKMKKAYFKNFNWFQFYALKFMIMCVSLLP